MEQFVVLIAIVIFWIFKGVSGAQRRTPGQDPLESGPLTKGGLDSTLEEANRRAIEALQRWEAKQALGGGQREGTAPATQNSPTRREPLPSPPRERSPRVAIARSSAERERRKAYADIAQTLDSIDARRFRARARSETTGLAPDPTPEHSEPAAPPRDESHVKPESEAAPKASRKDRPSGGKRRTSRSRPLDRLERIPMPARAIIYAEILGPPPYHR